MSTLASTIKFWFSGATTPELLERIRIDMEKQDGENKEQQEAQKLFYDKVLHLSSLVQQVDQNNSLEITQAILALRTRGFIDSGHEFLENWKKDIDVQRKEWQARNPGKEFDSKEADQARYKFESLIDNAFVKLEKEEASVVLKKIDRSALDEYFKKIRDLTEADLLSMASAHPTPQIQECLELFSLMEKYGISASTAGKIQTFWIADASYGIVGDNNFRELTNVYDTIVPAFRFLFNINRNLIDYDSKNYQNNNYAQQRADRTKTIRFLSSAYALRAKGNVEVVISSHRPEVEIPALVVGSFFWDNELPVLRSLEAQGIVSNISFVCYDRDRNVTRYELNKNSDIPLVRKDARALRGKLVGDARFYPFFATKGKYASPRPMITARKLMNLVTPWQTKVKMKRAVLAAARAGRLDILRQHMNALGVDIDYTPLIWACRTGNIDLAKALLAQGKDINEVDNSMSVYYPIVHACMQKDVEMVKFLLNAGATVDEKCIYDALEIRAPDDILKLIVEAAPESVLRSVLTNYRKPIDQDNYVDYDSYNAALREQKLHKTYAEKIQTVLQSQDNTPRNTPRSRGA